MAWTSWRCLGSFWGRRSHDTFRARARCVWGRRVKGGFPLDICRARSSSVLEMCGRGPKHLVQGEPCVPALVQGELVDTVEQSRKHLHQVDGSSSLSTVDTQSTDHLLSVILFIHPFNLSCHVIELLNTFTTAAS